MSELTVAIVLCCQDAVHRTKLNTLIMFPINGLDLRHHVQKATPSSSSTLSRPVKSGAWTTWKPGRKTTDSSEDYLYDLYAVCNHYGDMHGGHYTGAETKQYQLPFVLC